ncbi:MAG: hypothetical protein ACYCYF_00955 [Anaerolineae bacterium]
MKTLKHIRIALALVVALAGALALMPGFRARAEDAAPISGDGIVPIVVAGNPSCSDLHYGFGFKIERAPWDGVYNVDGVNTITVYDSTNYIFSWLATLGIDAVIVKGGPEANAYVYIPEDNGDTGLGTPALDAEISHIEFCYDYELTASKTAVPSYSRTYTWTIDKRVNGPAHAGFAGDTFSSDYDIVLDQTVVDSDFTVAGVITVNNPTPFTVGFGVSDSVGGTAASVSCPAYSLNPFSSTTCTYSASLAGAVDGTNTATITSNQTGVYGATATANYDFGEPTTVVGYPSVNVTDTFPYPGGASEALGSASGDYEFDNDQSFSCSTSPDAYTNGSYSYQRVNRAQITETGQFDETTVTVTCYRPIVTKTAIASYDETHTWNVQKSVDPTMQNGILGDVLPWTWTVTATQVSGDSNFAVSGTISVQNPAPMAMTVNVTDALNDAAQTAATVDCDAATDGNQTSLTVPASSTRDCSYSAAPSGRTATQNVATATINGAGFTGAADVTFVKNVIGGTATLVDSTIGLNESLSATQASWTFTRSGGHTCSTDATLYAGDGMYGGTVNNKATLTASNGQTANASASTSYACYAPLVSKTAEASYDETHTWEIAKSVDVASQFGFPGDVLQWTWAITVTETSADSDFEVSGVITITNPSPEDAMTVSVYDALNTGTGATVDCDSATAGNQSTLAIPANSARTCSYSAAPSNALATLNTATATLNSVPFTGTAAVSFVKNVINPTAELTDPHLGITQTLQAGVVTWTSLYTETVECSELSSNYEGDGSYGETVSNTAYLAPSSGGSANAQASTAWACYAPVVTKDATATYDETHTWDVQKSVTPLSQSGYPGDQLSWTWYVTVTETLADSNFAVTGTISIANPAPVTMTVTVADVLDDQSPVDVDCDPATAGNQTSLVIPAGATRTCSYSAAPDDASAKKNTATATLNDVAFSGEADVTFVANVINPTAVVTDTQIGLNRSLTAGQGPWKNTGTYRHTCSIEKTTYGEDGEYGLTAENIAIVTGSDGQSDSASASTEWLCEAGYADLLKLTNGVVNPEMSWSFALYRGPDGFGTTAIGSGSTLGDADGVLEFGDPALRPDAVYTICELGVPAGYASVWKVGDVIVIPYNPDENNNPPENLGNLCVDFGEGTSIEIRVGETIHFVVDNTQPGGDPRTPGYWKNWNRCTGGSQQYTADANGGWEEGFWLLEDVLNPSVGGGIVWDDILTDSKSVNIASCEMAVEILDQRIVKINAVVSDGKKIANDAARTLAMHLLAAQLNFGAGACVTQEVLDKALEAERLLDKLDFDGTNTKAYLTSKSKDYAYALGLAKFLDEYNNGMYCGSTFQP